MIDDKILWISPFVPYDNVLHAGGKVHNYYIKYFKKNLNYDITLLTFAEKKEIGKIDLNRYGISYNYIIQDKSAFMVCLKKIINMESEYNPFRRYGNGISNFSEYGFRRLIREYYKANRGWEPRFIIMQWTQAGLMIDYLKKIYPNSIYVIIEEDVSFQGTMRKVELTSNFFLKSFRKMRAIKYKQAELNILNRADIVTVNNNKDKRLLVNEKICKDKIIQLIPYFDDMTDLKLKKRNKNIVFYGAMNRKENYLSAIWFIKNVFSQLDDNELKFLIIGGNPDKSLFQYASERIEIVGYVQNVGNYFENSLCFVAPLILGAGIKIKVLEALSAGIPVITNEIGAEGIGIIKGKHYFHCDEPAEYISAINQLRSNEDLGHMIGQAGRQFIIDNFDVDSSLNYLNEKMISIVQE